VEASVFWGIFFMGFVFGYLLYYSVRHTKEFNIELLSSAIGAVGGGAVISLFEKTAGWLGPYGIGIGCGFLFYLVLSLVLILTGQTQVVTGSGPVLLSKRILLARTLLGIPRQE
jgi:hypothetical protein